MSEKLLFTCRVQKLLFLCCCRTITLENNIIYVKTVCEEKFRFSESSLKTIAVTFFSRLEVYI